MAVAMRDQFRGLLGRRVNRQREADFVGLDKGVMIMRAIGGAGRRQNQMLHFVLAAQLSDVEIADDICVDIGAGLSSQ